MFYKTLLGFWNILVPDSKLHGSGDFNIKFNISLKEAIFYHGFLRNWIFGRLCHQFGLEKKSYCFQSRHVILRNITTTLSRYWNKTGCQTKTKTTTIQCGKRYKCEMFGADTLVFRIDEGRYKHHCSLFLLHNSGTQSLRNLIWRNTWFKRTDYTAIRVYVKLETLVLTIDDVCFVQTGLEDDGSERRWDGTHRRTTRLQERSGATRQDQTAASRPARSTGAYSCVLWEKEL